MQFVIVSNARSSRSVAATSWSRDSLVRNGQRCRSFRRSNDLLALLWRRRFVHRLLRKQAQIVQHRSEYGVSVEKEEKDRKDSDLFSVILTMLILTSVCCWLLYVSRCDGRGGPPYR